MNHIHTTPQTLFTLVLLLTLPFFAKADTTTWIGVNNANWNVGGNWSTGQKPDQNDFVVIPPGVPNFPTLNGQGQAASLTIRKDATLTIGSNGTLIIENAPGNAINNRGALNIAGDVVLSGATGAGIYNTRSVLVAPSGALLIENCGQEGIENNADGTLFLNRGNIEIFGVESAGIKNAKQAVFTNQFTGTLMISNTGLEGVLSEGAGTQWNNFGVIDINPSIGASGIRNREGALFSNRPTGVIFIDNATQNGLDNSGDEARFENAGKLLLTGGIGQNGIRNFATGVIHNLPCGEIINAFALRNLSEFINDGYLTSSFDGFNQIEGVFTNNGVVEDIYGNFTGAGLVNNEMIVAPLALPVNGAASPALVGFTPFDYSIADLTFYADQALSIPAGEYDSLTNTLTDKSGEAGVFTWYFEVSDPENACPRTLSIQITLVGEEEKISLRESLSGQTAYAAAVFPNPASDVMFIRLPDEQAYQIRWFNAAGQLVASRTEESNAVSQWNVSNWIPGLYWVEISSARGREVKAVKVG